MTDANTPQLGQSALTPLLDVLFLLLFALLATAERDALVGSSEVDSSTEISVQLPEVAPDSPDAPGAVDELRVGLVVEADGTVSLTRAGAEPLMLPTTTALQAALAEITSGQGTPSRPVVEVRADADARHAVVVDVLQTLWSEGVIDVRFIAAIDRDGDAERVFGGEVR